MRVMTVPEPAAAQPLLEVRDLRKWYPVNSGMFSTLFSRQTRYVKAVDGIDLILKRGEIVGIVGESGSGKSTLGELVVRLQEPTGGNILFDGTSITEQGSADLKRFRRMAQVIFQDPYATLNPRFDVRRTIAEPLIVNGVRQPQEQQTRIELALQRSGLNPDEALLNAYPHKLSGGQRQRVAIARAIVLEPKLLIADEPVSMLDVSVRSGILNLLSQLRSDLGISILFISHDLSTVQYLCNRLAIMYLGRIMEIGPTERIIEHAYHPYSRALLNAVPVVDPEKKRQRTDINEEPSDATNLPQGCRFANRCAFVTKACQEKEPILEPLQVEHFARCIHPRYEPMWTEID